MGELTVSRWHRYGKERLYVNDKAGERVGWYDLRTGTATLERVEFAEAFEDALAPHVFLDNPQAPVPDPESPPQLEAPPRPTGESFTDLALRRPGEGVRALANAAWKARKQSSKFRAYADRLRDVNTQEWRWRRGAEGEEVVGKDLEALRSRGWHVLHSVPVGNRESDIDHVVIGPGGVFTINTKNHPGKRVNVTSRGVWVSGHRTFYIRNSAHEAERASRLLSSACAFPVVAGGIVVIRAEQLRRKAQPHEIWIFSRRELIKWLKKRPAVLDAETVDAIYAQARRGEAWRS